MSNIKIGLTKNDVRMFTKKKKRNDVRVHKPPSGIFRM